MLPWPRPGSARFSKAMMGLVRAIRAAVLRNSRPRLNAFQVQDDDAGVDRSGQIFQNIHHIQVAGVPHVMALPHLGPVKDEAPPETPGLGHHGQGRRLRVRGTSMRRCEAAEGVEDPWCWAPNPRSVLPGFEAHQFGLEFSAPGVGVGKPLADHHQPLIPCCAHSTAHGHHPLRPVR